MQTLLAPRPRSYTYRMYFLLVIIANHWVIIQAERIFFRQKGKAKDWGPIHFHYHHSLLQLSTVNLSGARTYFQQELILDIQNAACKVLLTLREMDPMGG